MEKEKLLPHSIGFIAMGATVGIAQLIENILASDLPIPIHRSYAEDWMEYSPYFVVFDELEFH